MRAAPKRAAKARQSRIPVTPSGAGPALPPMAGSEAQIWANGATFATCLLVAAMYLCTLAPSVVGGDAGELVTAAATGGIPHPPGYPLYALLGTLFLLPPFGEPALRMNLFSLVCGVAAAGFLQRAAARLSGSHSAGMLAAACFAFSPIVWEHSVGAEVFALHHAFVAVLLWIAVGYAQTGKDAWVWAGAGVAALAMSHHHTIVFFAVPMALWPVMRQPRAWLRPRRVLALAGIGLAGLLPYAWLALVSRTPAAVSWGDWTSLEGAWIHFTRAEYGSLQLAAGEVTTHGGFALRLREWFFFQSASVGWIGWIAVAAGFTSAWNSTRWRSLTLCCGGMLLFYILLFNRLANLSPEDPLLRAVLVRFWTAPHLIVCLWLAHGWVSLTHATPRLSLAGALGLAILPVLTHFHAADRRGAREFSDYGAAWLGPLPEGAVLLARGDLIINTIQYRQHGTGFRRDVRVFDLERMAYKWHTSHLQRLHPDLVLPGQRYQPLGQGGYPLQALIAANPHLGPWFVAGDLTPAETNGLAGWTLRPHGLGWRLLPPGEPSDFEIWWEESEAALPRFPEPPESRRNTDPWSAAVTADLRESRNRRGVAVLEMAATAGNPPHLVRRAVAVFEEESRRPDPTPRIYKNLGLAWRALEGKDPRALNETAAAWSRYLELEDGSDPDAALIRQWLQTR